MSTRPDAARAESRTPLPLSLFDFHLPDSHIAQHPVAPRDASRLMVLRGDLPVAHQGFVHLPEQLAPGDLLVVNRTQVIPARLLVQRPSGGRVELLFFEPQTGSRLTARRWRALARPANKMKAGGTVVTAGGTPLTIVGREDAAVVLQAPGPLLDVLMAEGKIPLPPYLKESQNPSAADAAGYQSMFAQEPGAVAAPTASLHFTPAVQAALTARGVARADVLLHVGPGTFLPVRPEHADDVHSHVMHGEHYAIPAETLALIAQTRARGNRVVAVGTTSLRALETWAQTGAPSGESSLFITPGYTFAVVDALVTNFHLPRSTLLMLVSAMAGRERILAAYDAAVTAGYRFFSFGDAMLIIDQKH